MKVRQRFLGTSKVAPLSRLSGDKCSQVFAVKSSLESLCWVFVQLELYGMRTDFVSSLCRGGTACHWLVYTLHTRLAHCSLDCATCVAWATYFMR